MMADIEPDLHPASTSSTDYEVANIADNDGEYQVEQIISDRLMRGYTLLAGACPVCSTPLIKNEREKARSTTDESVFNDPKNKFPIVVSSESFEQPFIPVIGVPFCVICHSHVVTSAEDVDLLETSESFKEKGSILVAMQDDERREEMENTASGEDTAQHAEHQEQHPVEGDDSSEMDANSFNKSISSIMKESESVVGRPPMVDPNRFSTALFCGTTASRQMVSSSPVNVEGEEADEKSQVPDPYNDMRHGGGFDGPVVEQEFEGSAFADALEEVDEDEDAAAVAVDLKEMITDFTLTVDISAPPILDNDEEEKKEEKMYEETYKDTYEEEDEDEEDGADVMMIEYSVRREIATKLMGAKMLEGYTFRDAPCDKCGMPVMEYGGDLSCVVCPVLLQQRGKEEKPAPTSVLSPVERKAKAFETRWVREANNAVEEQANQKEEERLSTLRRQEEAELQRELELQEMEARRQAETEREMEIAEMEARYLEKIKQIQIAEAAREAEIKREMELEMEIIIDTRTSRSNPASPRVGLPPSSPRLLLSPASSHASRSSPRMSVPASPLVEAALSADPALLEARMYTDAKLHADVEAAEDERRNEEAIETESALLQYRAMSGEQALVFVEDRKANQLQIAEETRRLELMEEQRIMEEALKNEVNFREGQSLRNDAALEADRQRQIEVTLQEVERLAEIEAAEEARILEEQEMIQSFARKRLHEDDDELAAMEQDAAQKQWEADDAIAKAQMALEEVSGVKRGIFAQAIAQAEADAIAEAEADVEEETQALRRSEVLKKSVEDLEQERWTTLRAEGRSTLTRRMMLRWKLNDDLCRGEHCRHSPIVTKEGQVECVVCGGSGDGKDGVYSAGKYASRVSTPRVTEVSVAAEELVEDLGEHVRSSIPQADQGTVGTVGKLTFANDDFESKRDRVSKDIGRKMIEGWTLLDLSCPHCVMPLMIDGLGGQETCVLCGPVELEDEQEEPQQYEYESHIEAPMLSVKNDPPASVASSASARDDPPASFFGEDYNPSASADESPQATQRAESPRRTPRSHSPRPESPRAATSPRAASPRVFSQEAERAPPKLDTIVAPGAPAEYTPKFFAEKVALDLPAGVDKDDDLMSIAQSIAQAAQEKEEMESENKITTHLDPIVADSNHSMDNVSYTSPKKSQKPPSFKSDFDEVNANSAEIPRIGSRAVPPKPMATVGGSPSKLSKRLPPRPDSRERPPISPGGAAASPSNSVHNRSSRRGPPRPEEGSSGGRRWGNARSVSPQVSCRQGSANRDSLSLSLDHEHDRDDVSLISDGGFSKAETIVMEALDTILLRIEECKAVLATTPQTEADFAKQMEMASMIEKLASAAVAVRKLEEMGLQ